MGRTTLSSQSIEHFLPLDRQPGWHDSNPTVGWGPGEKVPLHLAQTSFLALWRVFGGLSALIPMATLRGRGYHNPQSAYEEMDVQGAQP